MWIGTHSLMLREEQLINDGCELSVLIDFLSDNEINKDRAHSRHRRVYTQQTDDGIMEVVEEENVGADRLADGPEELPGANSGNPTHLSAGAKEVGRKRSVISREKPARPKSAYPVAPIRALRGSLPPSSTTYTRMQRAGAPAVFSPSLESERPLGFVKPPSPRTLESTPTKAPLVVKEGCAPLSPLTTCSTHSFRFTAWTRYAMVQARLALP